MSDRNAPEAARIGGLDSTVISNPIHNRRDIARRQQLERCRRRNRFNAAPAAVLKDAREVMDLSGQ